MLGRLAAVVGSGAAVAAYHHGFVGKTPTSRILAEEADTALPVPQKERPLGGVFLNNDNLAIPPAPDDFQLVFVQCITRHGLRTPIHAFPVDEEAWMCPHVSLEMGNVAADMAANTSTDFEGIPFNQLYRKVYDKGGTCYTGQLTKEGMDQMRQFGTFLRDRYVHDLELLPPTFHKDYVYVRSTDVNRTIETAQMIMTGLFPQPSRKQGADGIIDIHTMDRREENMYPRSGCKRLQLRKKVIRTSPSYKKRKDELGPYEEDVADALDLRKFPGWASVQNTLDCMIGYGKERPERLTDELVRQIAVGAGWEDWSSFCQRDLMRMGLGRFTQQLASSITAAAQGRNSHRFELYSGHDSTVAPLLGNFTPLHHSILGVYDGFHPDMGSSIILELWNGSNGHYVRVLYNGKQQILRGDTPFVPLRQFLADINDVCCTDLQYQRECANTTM